MSTFILGIGGGTGSGKSTIARRIATMARGVEWQRFGSIPARDVTAPESSGHLVTVIEHDAYYRDLSHLPAEARRRFNFDHPDALETSLLAEHLEALRAGAGVDAPVYDFASHTRRPQTRRLTPAGLVIVEGILVLADERLRALFDVKVFVDADADVRIRRRLSRDLQERGRSLESVREQYARTVRPMHLAYVEPSRQWADVIVPGDGDVQVAVGLVAEALRLALDRRSAGR